MKNKGFTLTELIAAIVILSIIIVLGVVTYTNIRKNVLQKEYNNLVTYLETKAASYADETGELNVTVEKLIETGYIEGDKNNQLLDPRDKSIMNCYLIDSIYENGNYVSKIESKLEEVNGKCGKYIIKKEIQICVDDGNGCKTEIQKWYNKNVTLKVLVGGLVASEGTTVTWKANGEVKNQLEYETKVSLINKGTYTVEVKSVVENPDGTTKVFEGSDTIPLNIDIEKPVITKIQIEKEHEWLNQEKNINVSMTDNNGSGVREIVIFDATSGKTCTSNDLEWITNTSNSYTTKLNNGSYQICVKDDAGNISDNLVAPIVIEKIDMVAPKCNYKVSGDKIIENSNWYTGNATIEIEEDLEEVSGIISYGITTTDKEYYNMKNSVTQSENTTNAGVTYYIWLRDKAGNKSSCNTNIKVDKTNPKCNITITGTKKDNNWYITKTTIGLNREKGASDISGYDLLENATETYNNTETIDKTSGSNMGFYGYVLAASGRKGNCKVENINVDTTAPGIENITQTAANTDSGPVTISTTISDLGSKLAAYAITDSSSEPTSWTPLSGSPENKELSKTYSTSGTYYVWAKDKAGNINSKSANVTIKYKQTTKVRYENIDGTWSDYAIAEEKLVNKGSSYSWSRAKDGTYNEASVTSYIVTGDKTNNISVYRNRYTISFDANGGSGGQSSNVNAIYDAAMPSITSTKPTRIGYEFAGWYDDRIGGTQYYTAAGASAKNWDKTSNTTLYARWTANTYTVNFDANGGTGSMSPQSFTYGSSKALKKNSFTKTGYKFIGWNTKSDGSGTSYDNKASVSNLTSTNNATVTLYAQWLVYKTIISFDSQGGSGGQRASVTATYGEDMPEILTTPPTKEGYTFNGWYNATSGGTKYYNADGTSAETWNKTKDAVTLYARWTGNKIYVQLNYNDFSADLAGKTLTINTYSYSKPIAQLYYTSVSPLDKKQAYNITFKYVGSTAEENEFHLYHSYEAVDGMSGGSSGVILGATTTSKIGNNVFYWGENYTKQCIGLEGYNGQSTITAWSGPRVGTITISNMRIGKEELKRFVFGSPYGTLPSPTRQGYEFAGWYTDIDGGTQVTSKTIVTNPDFHYLYGRWIPIKYNINFNSNGGSGSMTSMTNLTYGEYYTLNTNSFSKSGYVFSGWNTKADGTGATYGNGARITDLIAENGATVTLYAQWQEYVYYYYEPPCDTQCQANYNSATWHTCTSNCSYYDANGAYHSSGGDRDTLHQSNVGLYSSMGINENTNYNSHSGEWTDNNGKCTNCRS